MKKWQQRSLLMACVGTVALVMLLGLLLSPKTSLFSQPEQPKLELVIISQDLQGAKAKFLLGEPIRLHLSLRNVSKEPQTGAFYLSLDTNTLYVFIAQGDGPFELYVPQSLAVARVAEIALKPITLQPGEKREGFEFISYDADKKDFAMLAQGKYRIKAELRFSTDRSQKLESNVIEVEVVQSESQEDKEALQFIIDKQLKAYLTPEARLIPAPEGKTVNDQVQLLQEFLKKFEKSTYAPYVKLALAAICQGREQELPACKP